MDTRDQHRPVTPAAGNHKGCPRKGIRLDARERKSLMKVRCKVNSKPVEVEASPDEMLLEVVRRDLDLRSVRAACGVGICGACTALVNGEPISTCIFLAPLAEGCEITTTEGLGGDHPVQRAFEE